MVMTIENSQASITVATTSTKMIGSVAIIIVLSFWYLSQQQQQ